MDEERSAQELRLVGKQTFEPHGGMYLIVDFLNKSLKERGLIFGLSKDQDGNMVISIYEA